MTTTRIRRLHRQAAYVGRNGYFVTIATKDRKPVFRERQLVESCLETLELCAERQGFVVLAHCFMPDHLHVLVEGTTGSSELSRFVKDFKQRTGYRARRGGLALWQTGFHERILRQDEDRTGFATYIAENPANAGLGPEFAQPPFTSNRLPRRPDLQVGRQGIPTSIADESGERPT
jgi:putative transposase